MHFGMSALAMWLQVACAAAAVDYVAAQLPADESQDFWTQQWLVVGAAIVASALVTMLVYRQQDSETPSKEPRDHHAQDGSVGQAIESDLATDNSQQAAVVMAAPRCDSTPASMPPPAHFSRSAAVLAAVTKHEAQIDNFLESGWQEAKVRIISSQIPWQAPI